MSLEAAAEVRGCNYNTVMYIYSMKRLTWGDMYNYLIQQPNCIIFDQELTVADMHHTLRKLQKSIELHEPDQRNKNHNCKVLKRILERIYKLHLANKFCLIES